MIKSKEFTKVTELGQLEDGKLVQELKNRLRKNRLAFITSEYCRKEIDALPEKKTLDLDSEYVSNLWGLLIEEAVTYLKRSDPREWSKEYKNHRNSGLPEDMSSLKAFGVDKLRNYFIQFKEFEKILYGAVDYYRGHTLHVLRVWMLGALLLDDLLRGDNYPHIDFFDYIKENTAIKVSELISHEEIQAMWCIIALSHDLGYPLQKVDKINDQTRNMLRQYAKVNLQDLNFDVPQQHQFINDFILKFISSITIIPKQLKEEYDRKLKKATEEKRQESSRKLLEEERIFRTHIQSKYYLKYSKSLEDFDHGIFSSILLMKSLTYFLESDFDMDELKPLTLEEARQCAIRREILRAIACHTCEQIYHIHPDTLGFMLILCDELQSWGRPTFEEITIPQMQKPTAKLNKFSSKEVDYELGLPGDAKTLERRTRVLFIRLHKMLRVAVDTPERECTCQVTVKSIEKVTSEYKFNFESEYKKPPKVRFEKDGRLWNLEKESDTSPSM